MTDAATHFAQTYAEAREKFLAAAQSRGLAVETHVLPGIAGAQGETLATDVVRVGPSEAPGLLVLTSATHGVEGFCGSGAQIALLADGALHGEIADSGVAVLFVHAVNPYGFSHVRRVNEDNADLNRNFRDFSKPPPANAGYAELHAVLLPDAWPPDPAGEAVLGAYVAKHGAAGLQAAISGGQYAYPDGMFYGGDRPAWSNRMLRGVLRSHGAARARLGWLDFHTGLGPWGHCEKIWNGREVATDLARAKAWWGADVTSFFDGSSTSAPLTGVCGNAAYDECPQAQYAGVALEYGTKPLDEVLLALRADHWLNKHPDAPLEQRAAIKRQMRDAFYGDADDWKEAVVNQAQTTTLAALGALSRVAA